MNDISKVFEKEYLKGFLKVFKEEKTFTRTLTKISVGKTVFRGRKLYDMTFFKRRQFEGRLGIQSLQRHFKTKYP